MILPIMSKPKNLWQWLALLSPGAASVALTAFGKLLPRDQELGPSLVGLPIALLLCVVLAYLWARGASSPGKMIGLMLLLTLGLAIVNLSIALGGCALMNPYFNMH